jgi:glycosyltransferase involved in cell wall biosynthesis
LVDIYAQCDVFVMPSIEDGFGLVLAQALACGLPIIATTNTGAEDLLTMSEGEVLQLEDDILQYPSGFIVPIRRPDCIAFCIRKLQQNPPLLASMRAQALQIATKDFGWSHRAAEQIHHYERLLAQKRATPLA